MPIDLEDFKTTRHDLRRPLLLISGPRGVLACGYLSVAALERNGDAAAIVRGVNDFSQMLAAEVVEVTTNAEKLGINRGDRGRDALAKFS